VWSLIPVLLICAVKGSILLTPTLPTILASEQRVGIKSLWDAATDAQKAVIRGFFKQVAIMGIKVYRGIDDVPDEAVIGELFEDKVQEVVEEPESGATE